MYIKCVLVLYNIQYNYLFIHKKTINKKSVHILVTCHVGEENDLN